MCKDDINAAESFIKRGANVSSYNCGSCSALLRTAFGLQRNFIHRMLQWGTDADWPDHESSLSLSLAFFCTLSNDCSIHGTYVAWRQMIDDLFMFGAGPNYSRVLLSILILTSFLPYHYKYLLYYIHYFTINHSSILPLMALNSLYYADV